MSEDSKRKEYERGYNESKNAKPIDDVSKGAHELLGARGLFKTDEQKAFDQGWEDGSKHRSENKGNDKTFISSIDNKTNSNHDTDYSNDYESYSGNYGSTSSSNDYSSPFGGGILILLIAISLIGVYFIITGKKSDTEKIKTDVTYYSQSLILEPGRMYEITWNDFSARPYEVNLRGLSYKTYNYFDETGQRTVPNGRCFEAVIEYPSWKVRVKKKIEFNIGFTKTTTCTIKDVTGKFKNTQLNNDGNLYERFKVYR